MNPEEMEGAPTRLPFPVTRSMPEAIEFRAEGDGKPMLRGRFTTFNDPYAVDSAIEGHFIERMAPGAFDRTVVESRKNIKVLFNHGQDPTMGDQVLGSIVDLNRDATYVVDPFDGIPPLIRSGLEAGAYGASHRFSVIADTWDYKPKRSAENPDGVPERLITEARLYEFGPVTFPANPNATAGIRSTTDDFYQQDFETVLRSAQALRAAGSPQTDAGLPPSPESDALPPDPAPPPTEVALKPKDPPEGGSSDSRKESMEPVEFNSIEEMRTRHGELNDALETRQAAHPTVMPEDEQIAFDRDVEERDKLAKYIAAFEARQAKLQARAAIRDGVEVGEDRGSGWTPSRGAPMVVRTKSDAELHSPESRSTTVEGREAEYRDDAKRILDKTSLAPSALRAEKTKDALDSILDYNDVNGELARRIKYTSAPAYMRAFHKYITSKGETFGFTPEEQRGTALAVGVDTTGGFAVPFAFDPTVIHIGAWSGAVNPYRAACRVVTISGTDTWNSVTATAVTATRTTEAAAATEQGPTFAQPLSGYIVKRAQGQITASFEMFQDRVDLASEMATLIQEAKDNEEEASWATGNGSGTASIGVGPVTGTSGSYTRVSTAGAGAIVAGDLDTLEANLPVRHRFRAQWFGNRLNIRRVQSLETAGGKLFQQSQYFQSAGNVDLARDGNTGLRLLGYPVNESPSLPTSTATTITGLVLLNVDQYVIVDRIGLSVQFIPFIFNSSALATGQQALYFIYRNHAAPLNTDSGRILQYL